MSLNINQIELLAKDRPLISPEIYQANAFYGHAFLLKKYLGIDTAYPLKAAIEHGPTLSEFVWDADLNSPCPIFLCANNLAQRLYTERCDRSKTAISIGPLFCYPQNNLHNPRPVPNKRTLLVFPNHSTHHTSIVFDLQHHLDIIKQNTKYFDRIIVCVYWKDVLRGLHRTYAAEGFECTTAGHMFDPEFLDRLRAIINQSTAVLSFACGTSVLYSVLLGKPSWIAPDKNLSFATKEVYFERLTQTIGTSQNSMLRRFQQLFREPCDSLSEKQIDFVREATGYNNMKTKNELMRIIHEAEERFCAIRHLKLPPIPMADSMGGMEELSSKVHPIQEDQAHGRLYIQKSANLTMSKIIALMKEAVQELNAGHISSALDAINKAKTLNSRTKGLECLMALCLLRLNKVDAARESLHAELAAFPDNETARNLLCGML